MGDIGFWGIAAALFAVAGGTMLGACAARALRQRGAAAAILAAGRKDRMAVKAQSWSRFARPVARRLMAVASVDVALEGSVRMLEERGMSFTKEGLASSVVAAAAAAGVVCLAVSGSPAFGATAAVLAVVGSCGYAKNAAEKRNLSMREEVPEALRSMSTCFRSGLSLMQTLHQTAKETGGALGGLFSVAERRLRLGSTSAEALAVMRGNPAVPELAFVAVALDVQHQSGGSVAPVLEAARDSVNSELDLMRSLRVQTAQAKLSASIVTVMPFVLVALFSFMSPDFLAPFFGSLMGMALLALALVMQLSGVMVVRHMLNVNAG